MKEIGGYIEFERYHGEMLHEDGLKLNCARSCLAYLILAKHIRKLSVPFFMCDAVFDLCRSYGVELRFYLTGSDLRPKDLDCERDDFILLANNYGQLTETEIALADKLMPPRLAHADDVVMLDAVTRIPYEIRVGPHKVFEGAVRVA